MSVMQLMALGFSFVVIASFILFTMWQLMKLSNSDGYTIDPESIEPFKQYLGTSKGWLVARVRQWPPIKFHIFFLGAWPFIEIERVKDQCGLISVYRNNKNLIGQIKIYNSYTAYIESSGEEIHAVPHLAAFTNICKKISYLKPKSTDTIFSIIEAREPDFSKYAMQLLALTFVRTGELNL